MEILIINDNHKVSNLVFSVCTLRVLGEDMIYRKVNTSLFPQSTFLAGNHHL
jgi:hypothetical protein